MATLRRRPAPDRIRSHAGRAPADSRRYISASGSGIGRGEKITDRESSGGIDESTLTKGQLRKLNALRKSVGDEIGEQAFAAWLAREDAAKGKSDGNAALIADALWPMVEQGTLAIPRGGYLIRRGRGRIIVERASG